MCASCRSAAKGEDPEPPHTPIRRYVSRRLAEGIDREPKAAGDDGRHAEGGNPVRPLAENRRAEHCRPDELDVDEGRRVEAGAWRKARVRRKWPLPPRTPRAAMSQASPGATWAMSRQKKKRQAHGDGSDQGGVEDRGHRPSVAASWR